MSEDIKDFAVAKEQLEGRHWDRIAYEDNKLQHHKQLIRQVPDISEHHYEECVEYLNKYVDVKNGDDARAYVEDPEAGNEKYPGKWRLVSNEHTKLRSGMMGIVQTLRYGFNTSISWDEALLLAGDNIAGDSAAKDDGIAERYLSIAFPNMDPEHTDDLVTTMLAAETVVNPEIEEQTHSGTWYYIHVRPTKIEDGSQRIICLLAKPRAFLQTFEGYGTPRETDVFYLWNVPRSIAQTVADGEKTGTGTIMSANYSTEQGTVDLIVRRRVADALTIVDIQTEDGCLRKVYQDYYYRMKLNATEDGYEDEDGNAFDIGSAPQGWIYRAPQIFDDNDGFFRIRVDKINSVTKDPAVAAHTISDSAKRSTERTQYLNVASVSDITEPSASTGTLASRNVKLNAFCQYDGSSQVVTSKPGSVTLEYEINEDFTQTHDIAWNQPSLGSVTGGTSEAYPEDSIAVGKERKISLAVNEDGTYNWHMVTEDMDEGLDDYGEDGKITYYKKIKSSYKWTWSGELWNEWDPWTQHLWVAYRRQKIEITQWKTAAEAYAVIDFNASEAGYLQGSKVVHHGRHKWWAIKITDDGYTGWTEITGEEA